MIIQLAILLSVGAAKQCHVINITVSSTHVLITTYYMLKRFSLISSIPIEVHYSWPGNCGRYNDIDEDRDRSAGREGTLLTIQSKIFNDNCVCHICIVNIRCVKFSR